MLNAYVRIAEAFDPVLPEGERWARARDVFAGFGASAISYGSAARSDLRSPTVVTSIPDAFLADYFASGCYAEDHWLEHCAMRAEMDFWDIAARDHRLHNRIGTLFKDHGYYGAALVPIQTRTLVSGITLMARNADEMSFLTADENRMPLRFAAASFGSSATPEVFLSDDDPSPEADAAPRLTTREVEVLSWLSAGLRVDRIAEKMRIRPVTVGKHIYSARTKLGARTREEALVIALRRRFVRP